MKETAKKGEAMDDTSRRLPWTCFSMDQNKGIVDGIGAHFWDDFDEHLLFAKRMIVKVP
jgi:hypothetical protein